MLYPEDNIHIGLEKIAAPKHIKVLRKLMAEGKYDEVAKKVEHLESSGILKFTPEGTNIQRLKPGAEAVPDIVVGVKGKKGLHVRKVYDPKGPLFSKRHFGERRTTMKRLHGKVFRNEDFVPASFHRGKGGARFSISPFLPDLGEANIGSATRESLGSAVQDTDVKARMASTALERKVTSSDILKARRNKRQPLIDEFLRRGMSQSEAESRALKMIPERGGSGISDLHSGNIKDKGGWAKVLDFNPVPRADEMKLDDWYRNEYQRQLRAIQQSKDSEKIKLYKLKKLEAKRWSLQASGKVPHLDDIRHTPSRGGYEVSGLSGGPKRAKGGEELHKLHLRTLGGLGAAKKQIQKISHVEKYPERLRLSEGIHEALQKIRDKGQY